MSRGTSLGALRQRSMQDPGFGVPRIHLRMRTRYEDNSARRWYSIEMANAAGSMTIAETVNVDPRDQFLSSRVELVRWPARRELRRGAPEPSARAQPPPPLPR